MLYYHATSVDNAKKILESCKIESPLHINYFCTEPEECLRFIYRNTGSTDCVVFEFDISEEDGFDIEESFDHSEDFFKCKAYCCTQVIPLSCVTNILMYGNAIGHKSELLASM